MRPWSARQMAGKDFRTVNHTENELDKMKKELEDTNDEVKTLAERFAELTAVLLGPGFAENNAVVFLEEMRDAALELAQAMTELSEAQAYSDSTSKFRRRSAKSRPCTMQALVRMPSTSSSAGCSAQVVPL